MQLLGNFGTCYVILSECAGAFHSSKKAISYISSPSMQLLGNFGTFYVILSECAGAMPMVPAPSLLMTHVPHDLPITRQTVAVSAAMPPQLHA